MLLSKALLVFSCIPFLEALVTPPVRGKGPPELYNTSSSNITSTSNQTVWQQQQQQKEEEENEEKEGNQTNSTVIKPSHESPKPLPPDDDTSPEFSTRTVNSKIFYGWRRRCPSMNIVFNQMDPDPNVYPRFGPAAYNRRPDPRVRPGPTYTRMQRQRSLCAYCECNEQGDLVTTPRDPPTTAAHCSVPYIIDRCKSWYNCSCQGFMRDPMYDPDTTIEEYQDALNQVPFWAKAQNPAWRWKPRNVRGLSMTWEGLGTESTVPWLIEGTERELVPGTKEPYYLEGPDQRDPNQKDLSWLRGPLSGYEALRSGSYKKRSITGEEGRQTSSTEQD
ncbi:hypothetical protein TWF225_007712 [Orbilia oligospora]|nr:hypothetical protein TWF225_007712 [Orbilia oligospora]KAF3261879.1 hypothetical protein TWF217_004440 [Orbilia oligospora]KAF3265930.1 hypothetical protein TWF128_011509 [Orbilia oligospora]